MSAPILATILVALALFSLLHSTYTMGWRNALGLFGITIVVAWSFEQASVATHVIYGAYHSSSSRMHAKEQQR